MRRVACLLLLSLMLVLVGCQTPIGPCADPEKALGPATNPLDAEATAKRAAKAALLEEMCKPKPWEFRGYASVLAIPNASLQGGDGTVSTWNQFLRFEAVKNIGNGGIVTLDVGYESFVYDFHRSSQQFANLPLPKDPIHGVGFRARYLQPFSMEWAAFVFGRVQSHFESGASPEDGISWLGALGIAHQFENGLGLGVGVAVIGRPVDELWIIPAPQFRWQINEEWFTKLDGSEFLIERQLEEQWKVGLAVSLEIPRARLQDGGIFSDYRVPAQFRLTWTPSAWTDLELRLGADLYRTIGLEDENGFDILDRRTDFAPHIGLRWKVRF